MASLAGLILIDRSLDDAVSARLLERQRTVEASANAVGRVVDSALARLEATAQALGPWMVEPDARRLEQAERLLSDPGLLGGTRVLVDREGIVRVASPNAGSLLGQQLGGAAIERALAGTEAVSGVVREQEDAGFIYLAVPVRDRSGEVTAAVVSRVDPTVGPLADLMDSALVGPTSVALVTGSGSVVAGPERIQVVSDRDPNTQLPTDIQGAGTVAAYRGEAGTAMTAAYAPVREGWRLVAFEPYDTFRAPFRTPFWIAAGVLIVVGALVVAGLQIGELRARRAESRAESAKRSLLAVAGHELRTPLTVVRGLGQTLVGRWNQLPDRNRHDMLRTIERQSRVLDHLVERLLYAAQLESDAAAVVTPRATDVARTVRRAVEDHGPLAPAHDLHLTMEEPLVARADAKALDQVMYHLLDNAVRYSPGGGTISVAASRADTEVRIVVEDEGVGLPADADAIFERFVQGEAVTTRTVDEGGVGLGLHIVRTLVELMGGTVRAESRETIGARFTITLPAERSS